MSKKLPLNGSFLKVFDRFGDGWGVEKWFVMTIYSL